MSGLVHTHREFLVIVVADCENSIPREQEREPQHPADHPPPEMLMRLQPSPHPRGQPQRRPTVLHSTCIQQHPTFSAINNDTITFPIAIVHTNPLQAPSVHLPVPVCAAGVLYVTPAVACTMNDGVREPHKRRAKPSTAEQRFFFPFRM